MRNSFWGEQFERTVIGAIGGSGRSRRDYDVRIWVGPSYESGLYHGNEVFNAVMAIDDRLWWGGSERGPQT